MGTVSGIPGVLDVAVVSGGGGGGSNAAAGATGSSPPADASYTGFLSGGTLVGVSSSAPLPITGTVTTTPTTASATGSAVPADATFLGFSAGGLLTGVSSSAPLPVTDSTNYATPDSRQVKVVSNGAILFSDDFGGTALSSSNWDVLDGGLPANPTLDSQSLTQSAIGSGTNMGNGTNGPANTALSVSASAVTIAMGTTSGAELWLLSKQAFAGTEDLFFTFLKSQALAANSICVGLVEVDPTTKVPLYNANTPSFTVNGQTVPAYFTNAGLVELGCQTTTTAYAACAIGDSSGVGAVGSTATALAAMTANSEFLLEFHAEDLIASNGAVDSAGAKSGSPSRVSSQAPDDGRMYRLLIRLRNIGAPGSSTTVTFGRVMLWDCQEMRVEVASGRGDANPQKGVPVNAMGAYNSAAVTLASGQSGPLQADVNGYLKVNLSAQSGAGIYAYPRPVAGIGAPLSTPFANATGTPAAQAVKSSAATLYGGQIWNTQSSTSWVYAHFYNAASGSVTMGTTAAALVIAVPPGGVVNIADVVGSVGAVFSTGLSFALTGGASATDTTAIGSAGVAGATIEYM